MNPMRSAKFVVVAMLCSLLTLLAEAPRAEGRSGAPATQPAMTTLCLGRFLVDVPVGSRLIEGSYQYNFAQLEKPVAMSRERFVEELDAREAVLTEGGYRSEVGQLFADAPPERDTRILTFAESAHPRAAVRIEGYRWMEGVRFVARTRADDEAQALAVARMVDRIDRIRPREEGEIPDEPGYCFEGGFIADREWTNEEVGVDIALADHPGVVVSIDIFPPVYYRHHSPLLDRVGRVLQQVGEGAASIHVLRQGERPVGPYRGEEHLVSARAGDGRRALSFFWEAQGEGALWRPTIHVEFSTRARAATGMPAQPPLTEAQALNLWERIVGSIRLRPAEDVGVSEGRPQKAPATSSSFVTTTRHGQDV